MLQNPREYLIDQAYLSLAKFLSDFSRIFSFLIEIRPISHYLDTRVH